MGSNQSNILKAHTDVLNHTMMNVINKFRSTAYTSCISNQTVNVFVGENAVIEGNLQVGQVSAVLCNLSGSVSSSMSSDMKSEIETALTSLIKQANSSEQGWLSTSFSNQNVQTTVEQYIRNVFESTVSNIAESDCRNYLNMSQDATVELKGRISGNVKIDQNIQGTAIANCLMNTVADNLFSNATFTQLYNDWEASNYFKQQGFGIALGIILAIVVAVIVGGVLLKSAKKGEKSEGASAKKNIVLIFVVLLVLTGIGLGLYFALK